MKIYNIPRKECIIYEILIKVYCNTFFTLLLIPLISVAGAEKQPEPNDNIYDYDIVDGTIDNLSLRLQDNKLHFSLDLHGKKKYNVEASTEFFSLEGMALTAHKIIGDSQPTVSNYEFLHVSISESSGHLDELIVTNNEAIFNAAVIIPEEKSVYRISYKIDKDKVSELIENVELLSLDNNEHMFV